MGWKICMVRVVVESGESNSVGRLIMTVAAPWGSGVGGSRFKKANTYTKGSKPIEKGEF